jgi:hypothetical protein
MADKCFSWCTARFGIAFKDVPTNEDGSQAQDVVQARINQAIAYDFWGQSKAPQNKPMVHKCFDSALVAIQPIAVGPTTAYEAMIRRDYADALWKSGDYLGAAAEEYKAISIFSHLK